MFSPGSLHYLKKIIYDKVKENTSFQKDFNLITGEELVAAKLYVTYKDSNE